MEPEKEDSYDDDGCDCGGEWSGLDYFWALLGFGLMIFVISGGITMCGHFAPGIK